MLTFSPSSFIPHSVVFTTMPYAPVLAQEISTDATISVSILRQVNVTEQITSTLSSASEDDSNLLK
ncbi:hypothetical protein C0992_009327, partial [Termitomyces sp. T32_za158]